MTVAISRSRHAQPLKIDIMLIKRKTIRRSRRGGSADGGGTQTVKVGENEYKQEGGVVSLPQYVTHIDDTIADRYPDNDGKVTLPKIPRSVSVNGGTYTPDSAGDIDLGTIGGGGGGSVNSVSANGTTYTPDGAGDVNVGAMVKAIRYINTDYSPDADGKVTINSIAGYFASGLNGLNINGTTQAPLSYDPTTQHIRYDLDAYNTTTSLRLMRNSGRNADAEAYEITYEIVARVVSADDTATRIVAYIDTDVRGEASGLTWMLCLSRYVAGSTPLAIAIKGLADAPRYWTANDAKLRQGSYSGTSGFHCDAFDDDDLTQWSSVALAAHAEPLYEGRKRYMLDVTITASKAYTVHAFDDVSRGAVGVNKITINGLPFVPDASGNARVNLGSALWVSETPFGLVPCFSTTNTNSDLLNRVTAISFLARPYVYSPTSIFIWRTAVSSLIDVTPYAIRVDMQTTHYEFNDTTKSATYTGNVIVTNKGVTTGNNNILSFLVVPFFFSASDLSKMQIALLHYDETPSIDYVHLACYNVDTWYPIDVTDENGFVETQVYNVNTSDTLASTYANYLVNKTNVITADAYITRWSVAVTVANHAVTSISVTKTASITL